MSKEYEEYAEHTYQSLLKVVYSKGIQQIL
jgi:hypothetical protein